MASASFALDDFVGSLAPTDGKLLYMARVNPVLTFASEIVLDVDETSAAKPADIQHHFLRRLLQVGHVLCWLHFSLETRLLPLRCRRVILAVSCLIYLLRLPDNHYAHIALQESKSLLRDGFSCWIADLNWVISHLPSRRRSNGAVMSTYMAFCQIFFAKGPSGLGHKWGGLMA